MNDTFRQPTKHPFHDEGSMTHEELIAHMCEKHGWTDNMIDRRGDIDDGAYLRRMHHNEHETAHLDPPGYWKSPKKGDQ